MSLTRGRSMLGRLLLAVLVIAGAFDASVIHAQPTSAPPKAPPPGALRLQVRGGFDGHGRIGGWLPVAADVINESPTPFTGELRVRVARTTSQSNFGSPPTTYTTPVSLPGRSHRRYSVEIRIPTTDTHAEASLVAAGTNDVIATQDVPLTRVSLGELFCGVVGRDARAYQFLAALDLPPPLRRARVVAVSPNELPAVGHLLGSFDCLILDGVNSAQLRSEQMEAIQVWLNGGGLLIAVGGAGWRTSLAALPAALLPVELQGLTSVESLDSLEAVAGQPLEQPGPWVVSRARLRAGVGAGRVLASQEGVPLVVAAKRGDGGIVYLAFDPTTPALLTWPGQAELWRYLLAHASVDSGTGSALVRPYLRWGRVPRWALADYSAHEDPGADWLIPISTAGGLLGAILVLILGAWRRPGLAVLGLAVVGVASTAGGLIVARLHAEPDLRLNHVTVIRPVALGEAAYTRTYVAALSHRDGAFTVQLPAGTLPFSLWYPSPRDSNGADSDWELTSVQAQQPQITDLFLAPSRLGTFAFDGQVPESAVRLEADLTVTGPNRVQGTITNRMDQRVEQLTLVLDSQVVPIGRLEPGQSTSVEVKITAPPSAGYAASQGLPSAILGDGATDQPPSLQRDVLNALFTQRFLIRRAELRGPTLVGWLSRDPMGVAVAESSASVQGVAVLLAPARVRLPLGFQGEVPGALLTKRFLGGGPTFAPDRDYYSVAPGDSINLQFTLPATDGPWDIEHLLVNLEASPFAMRRERPTIDVDTVSLFNWRQGGWQDWDLGGTTARIPSPQEFISATGDVRLRFHLDSGVASTVREVRVNRLDISPIIRVVAG